MDEIIFDDKTYVSSKRAAAITGYAKDYVGQLCREGRVEARLVGRNWYILEDSIREHRFGPEPVKPSGKDENGDWKAPHYAPDVVSVLPTINSALRIEPDQMQEIAPQPIHEQGTEPSLDHSTTIQEMQDAWQDWFTKKEQETPGFMDEMPPASTPSVEETVHVVRVEEPASEPVMQETVYVPPAAPQRVAQEEQDEIVPIHRTFLQETPVVAPLPRPIDSFERFQPTSNTVTYTQPAYTQEPVYGSPRQEGRILRERRVQKKKKPSVALQALFISIAGIAIVVALIGSGQADTFLNQNRIKYAPINYLGGENVVNNSK